MFLCFLFTIVFAYATRRYQLHVFGNITLHDVLIDKLNSWTLFERNVTGSAWTYWRKGESYASWGSKPISLCKEGVVKFGFFTFKSTVIPTSLHTHGSSIWLFFELCDCLCIIKNVSYNSSDEIRFGGESYNLPSFFVIKTYLTFSTALLEDTGNQHSV